MGDDSADVPLLSPKLFASKRKQSILISSTKWVLKSVMWVVFVLWVALMFFYPTELVTYLFEKLIGVTDQSLFGITGSLLLAFSGPVFVIAFLAVLYLNLSGDEEVEEKKTAKCPAFRLWTFPVLIDGPFGVVSAAELIGILLFAVFVIWAVSAYLVIDWSLISQYQLSAYLKSSLMLELTGLRFGLIGLFCLAFLFLPVARGSILLRLIDIPFEHATRYHVWLGHLTMVLFTFHGLFYVIAWAMQGELLKEILEWKDIGVANLAGVISLAAGLLMWVTSLPPVRKINFELFFYTHQLYVVFVVFLALHVGPFVFSIAAAGIFLFMLDRFLRFCQSRKTVDIISATSLPCGTLELVVSKPANLRYNALSFIFLQVRQLSWLEWHPFSVSSSPLDGKYHLSVLIKVLGQWTDMLKGNISSANSKPQKLLRPQLQSMITASVEGPYGHESPYHLTYRHLILVAGGIGISPFLAVLTDILHRIREGKPCLPRNILIVWAIKKSNELPLLSMLDMDSICPFFSDVLNLEIQIYITRETEPPLEEGYSHEAMDHPLVCPAPKGSAGISSLVGTGDNTWSGIYMIASTLGFITFLGLLDVYYINPYGISAWWYKGLLLVACMVAGVVIVGGLVVIFWHLWESRLLASEELDRNDGHVEAMRNGEETLEMKNWSEQSYISRTNIRYGCRPDFREIFGSIADGWGEVDVGVLVCGPPTLQSSVAREIRSHNLRRRKGNHPIFHFNSHSFDL